MSSVMRSSPCHRVLYASKLRIRTNVGYTLERAVEVDNSVPFLWVEVRTVFAIVALSSQVSCCRDTGIKAMTFNSVSAQFNNNCHLALRSSPLVSAIGLNDSSTLLTVHFLQQRKCIARLSSPSLPSLWPTPSRSVPTPRRSTLLSPGRRALPLAPAPTSPVRSSSTPTGAGSTPPREFLYFLLF